MAGVLGVRGEGMWECGNVGMWECGNNEVEDIGRITRWRGV